MSVTCLVSAINVKPFFIGIYSTPSSHLTLRSIIRCQRVLRLGLNDTSTSSPTIPMFHICPTAFFCLRGSFEALRNLLKSHSPTSQEMVTGSKEVSIGGSIGVSSSHVRPEADIIPADSESSTKSPPVWLTSNLGIQNELTFSISF